MWGRTGRDGVAAIQQVSKLIVSSHTSHNQLAEEAVAHPGTMASAYSMAEAMPATREAWNSVDKKYAKASSAAAVSQSRPSMTPKPVCGKGYKAMTAHSRPDSASVAKWDSAQAPQ